MNKYIVPDGYKAIGWNEKNEAILEKWETYYFKNKEVKLKSGEKLNGVIIEIKNP